MVQSGLQTFVIKIGQMQRHLHIALFKYNPFSCIHLNNAPPLFLMYIFIPNICIYFVCLCARIYNSSRSAMRRAHRSSPEFQYRKSLALLLIFRSSHKLCAPASSQQRSGGHFYDHRALAHSLAYYTCSSSAAAHKNHTHTHNQKRTNYICALAIDSTFHTYIY